MKLISSQELRTTLGITEPVDGPPGLAAVADLLRWTVWRAGPCLRSDATLQLQAMLVQAGYSPAHCNLQIQETLERLVILGDIAFVKIAGMERLAPVQPRIIPLDETGLAALVGTLPSRLLDGASLQHNHTITRRFSLDDVDTMATLIEAGAEKWPLQAWIGPPESSRLLRRFGIDDHTPLSASWDALKSALAKAATHDPHVSCFEPMDGSVLNSHFHCEQQDPVGDTTTNLHDMWIGTTPGDTTVPPVLVISDDSDSPGHVQLASSDEARWIRLLKALAQGPAHWHSVNQLANHLEIRCSTQPPQQAFRILDLFGDRVDSMSWRLSEESGPPVAMHLQNIGLMSAADAPQAAL